ncbi:MAG: phosphoglycerate mutase, partial [Terriglobia bacterium]
SAGHISTEEGAELIADLDAAMKDWPGRFVPGVSYRHLLIIEGDFDGLQCVPPHNAVGDSLDEAMPGGDQGQLLREMMAAARPVLENHPVNRARREKGLNPANMIWLWGQGRKPAFPSFMEKYGVGGAIISAVDLIKGIGHFAGLETPHVPGATAYFDTDLEAKTSSALAILKRDDFCFVHVEAPDEAGHTGQVATKVEMIENFDRRLVGPILAWLEEHGVFRVVVVPDHATPVELRVHTAEAVPFALYATGGQPDAGEHFSEVAARSGSVHVAEGHRLMDLLIRRSQD